MPKSPEAEPTRLQHWMNSYFSPETIVRIKKEAPFNSDGRDEEKKEEILKLLSEAQDKSRQNPIPDIRLNLLIHAYRCAINPPLPQERREVTPEQAQGFEWIRQTFEVSLGDYDVAPQVE